MIVDRVVKYLESKGIKVSAFEREMGWGNTTLSKAYKTKGAIGSDKIEKILSSCPDLSPLWLITGQGPMLKVGEVSQDSPHVKELPLIPFDAVAGPGTPVFEDSRVEEYYYVSEFKECDFLIRVKGDSMAPHFTGGDLLACRKVEETYFLQWNRCYVIYTRSQGCMVKRVQPSEKEGYIKCVSDNAKYAPFDVPMSDIVSVALVNGSISLE
jgi:SOS-response transcriptional repressor LexA